MQCFLYVTYVIIACSASQTKSREIATKTEKRSLFHDVLESFRIRAHLPDDVNENDENNLSNNYIRGYGFDNDQQLQGDEGFVPRRNDRNEMPSFKHRFPKRIKHDITQNKIETPKEEVNIEVDKSLKILSDKPKKVERLRVTNKHENPNDNKGIENHVIAVLPINNTTDQNQINGIDSIIQHAVIVDMPDSVDHQNSKTQVDRKDNNYTILDIIRDFLGMYQEILVKNEAEYEGAKKKAPNKKKHSFKVETDKEKIAEEDIVSEADTNKSTKQKNRKYDDVMQILFSI